MIRNEKPVDPSDVESPRVVQLETAMRLFDDATTITVSRSRFVPVKTTDDLLLLRSDCFSLQHGELSATVSPLPHVRLSDSYRTIEDFESRFDAAPSLVRAQSLDIQGDWRFETNTTVEGECLLTGSGTVEEGATIGTRTGSTTA